MPAPNIIQFSLNEDQRESLGQKSLEGESLGLTAKRLLLSLLGYEQSISLQEQQSIEDRLQSIENRLQSINSIEDRLQPIDFDKILGEIDFINDFNNKLWARVKRLEEQSKQPEQPALAIPEQPEQPEQPESPKQKKLTGGELARFLGKSPSAVSRWKERRGGLSPDGQWQYNRKLDKWVSPVV
jgi:hypothetical protein